MRLHAATLAAILATSLGPGAVAQLVNKQQSSTAARGTMPAARLDGELVRSQTITSTEAIASFHLPLRCDADGNIYLRTESGPLSAILKLNPKGERLSVFEPSSSPNFKIDVAAYFDLDQDGRDVYELVFPHEINRYVFAFGSDGTIKSTIKLQPGFPFMPKKLAVFPTGQFLISGEEYDADRSAAMWPFTGIFAADGRMLKEIELEDDKTFHDMAASGDTRAALQGTPHANRAIDNGQVEVAADGNAYLMRWASPAIFYVISPGGEVIRRFTVDPGDSGYYPSAMHVNKTRIAVLFVELQKGDGIMKVVDLEGHGVATYAEPKTDPKVGTSPLGAAFACYIENPTRFIFLGADDDNRLQLVTAEPR